MEFRQIQNIIYSVFLQNPSLPLSRNLKHEDMKGFAVFITSLFVTMSVSTQTEVKADTIGTSASDKFLDEIVIAAKSPEQ